MKSQTYRKPKHAYDVGTHLESPREFVTERGKIPRGAEIVILQADHVNCVYTIMDCLTGIVMPGQYLIPAVVTMAV